MSKEYWRSQANYYRGKVDWCQTNASQWSQKAAALSAQLKELKEQLAIARRVKAACGKLGPSNDDVIRALGSLGSMAASALECSSCTEAAKDIAKPNAGQIQDANGAIDDVIARLEQRIAEVTAQLNTANGNVSYFNGWASSYQASYNEAYSNYLSASDE
ncbi:hypothetical protein [Olsenella massiliensis]|uniref:hypothetical protein n=1 Tax=Olsenella massiliensis TaxID=1622075 RepID=UPI00071D6B1C|nr:hypothetical protein [Olsenella massiliensis]